MSSVKRYFYIQLKMDFFRDIAIQSMRKQDPAMVLTYIEMLLYVADKDYVFSFQGIQETIDQEFAVAIGKTPKHCRKVLDFLEKNKKIEYLDDNTISFPESLEMTGSITDSAERTAKWRERHKVTKSDTQIDTEQNTEKQTNRDPIVHSPEPEPVCDEYDAQKIHAICVREHINLDTTGVATFCYKMKGLNWKIDGKPIKNIGAVLRKYEQDPHCYDSQYIFA